METQIQTVRAFPDHTFRPLLRASFVAGPALLAGSALTFALGIGLIPPGVTSWVEGLIGSYALALFVPIYLELSRRLAVTHRRLAMATVVSGLFGGTAGFSMEFLRLVEHSLRSRGAGDVVWQAFAADPGGPLLAVALLGPLFPLTSILLGAGFFRARTLPRWVSLCLIAAGIGFPLAQVGGFPWALAWAYPAACGLWLISLGWVALSSSDAGAPAARRQAAGPGSRRQDVSGAVPTRTAGTACASWLGMRATMRLLIAVIAVSATAACGAVRAPLTTSFARLPDHLNVGDTVTVETANGAEVSGRLIRMVPDAIVVTGPSAERMLDASRVLRISACCDSLLNGTLIGFGSGALFGTAVAVGLSDGSSDLDGNLTALIFGGIGAGLGVGLDALVRSDRLVYGAPAVTPRARVGPRGGAVGITVSW